MSDETETLDEMAVLKNRAKMMGITHSNNIGLEALRTKINAKMVGEPEPKSQESEVNPLDDATVVPVKKLTLTERLMQQEMRLVRCRITNLDPKKKDLPSEIITIANEYIGTVRKLIPFGEATDDGYHIPYCIYTFLKNKKFLHIQTIKDSKGQPQIKTRMANEYSVEELPQLTQADLDKLGAVQRAAGLFNNDGEAM